MGAAADRLCVRRGDRAAGLRRGRRLGRALARGHGRRPGVEQPHVPQVVGVAVRGHPGGLLLPRLAGGARVAAAGPPRRAAVAAPPGRCVPRLPGLDQERGRGHGPPGGRALWALEAPGPRAAPGPDSGRRGAGPGGRRSAGAARGVPVQAAVGAGERPGDLLPRRRPGADDVAGALVGAGAGGRAAAGAVPGRVRLVAGLARAPGRGRAGGLGAAPRAPTVGVVLGGLPAGHGGLLDPDLRGHAVRADVAHLELARPPVPAGVPGAGRGPVPAPGVGSRGEGEGAGAGAPDRGDGGCLVAGGRPGRVPGRQDARGGHVLAADLAVLGRAVLHHDGLRHRPLGGARGPSSGRLLLPAAHVAGDRAVLCPGDPPAADLPPRAAAVPRLPGVGGAGRGAPAAAALRHGLAPSGGGPGARPSGLHGADAHVGAAVRGAVHVVPLLRGAHGPGPAAAGRLGRGPAAGRAGADPLHGLPGGGEPGVGSGVGAVPDPRPPDGLAPCAGADPPGGCVPGVAPDRSPRQDGVPDGRPAGAPGRARELPPGAGPGRGAALRGRGRLRVAVHVRLRAAGRVVAPGPPQGARPGRPLLPPARPELPGDGVRRGRGVHVVRRDPVVPAAVRHVRPLRGVLRHPAAGGGVRGAGAAAGAGRAGIAGGAGRRRAGPERGAAAVHPRALLRQLPGDEPGDAEQPRHRLAPRPGRRARAVEPLAGAGPRGVPGVGPDRARPAAPGHGRRAGGPDGGQLRARGAGDLHPLVRLGHVRLGRVRVRDGAPRGVRGRDLRRLPGVPARRRTGAGLLDRVPGDDGPPREGDRRPRARAVRGEDAGADLAAARPAGARRVAAPDLPDLRGGPGAGINP